MTELEKLCEQALYEEIQDLGDGKAIVRDVPTGRLFFRKKLSVYNTQVFAYLKEHKSRYVPRIESFREEGEKLIVIEEFIQGRTLDDLLGEEGGPLPFQERVRILTEICDGLFFLHNARPPIIHRDLKASNVMLTEDGVVKIIDYDAAKIYISGEKKDTVLMGTHGVAAPEQYGFAASDVRTDIFALGKLIERMLPENVDAARIVAKATHIDPQKRFGSAAQIREQIVRIREHASSLDTRLEKIIPGFDAGKKSHRVLGRMTIAALCALVLLAAGFAVWRFAFYPGQRREAMRAQMEILQNGDAIEGGTAQYLGHFFEQFPYEKMSEEEQYWFCDSIEKALAKDSSVVSSSDRSGNLSAGSSSDPSADSSSDESREQIVEVLANGIGDEQKAETIMELAEVEKLVRSGKYQDAFDKLRPIRESGSREAEEKWEDVSRRCFKRATEAEEQYKKSDGNANTERSSAKKALELYEILFSNLFSNGDADLKQDALDSYDRVFASLLDEADADSEAENYTDAEKTYVLLQECQKTEKTSQTDLEDRIHRNTYREAEKELSQEKYIVAAKLFERLEDYSDAPMRLAECRYLNAGSRMKEGEYKEAAELYALCSGYEDADVKILEAKFRYCQSVAEKPDDDAYLFIRELLEAGYPGAEEVRNTMYQWRAETRNELNYLIGSQQSTHIRVYLYGGPPEASTRIKIVTTDNVTGEEASWRSPETCSRGGCVDATYNVDSFDYSIFEREHTLNAYSDDGNLIGTWTGIFTKDFFSDET